ncbi:group II intron reverse transcriptase/maturase [Heyndrickxia acidiproducens]|uniref:group II intron reverse transcriptase/maturase n=1 Tax=Heyndrickxia acidiproducens TaxID=1121084 RepID=UPI00035D62D4|nr:group II intron reverse transcriptase/maturase [Heyndrickxia acidiproducens]
MRMEQVLSRENLLKALHRVEENKGSHGVDGMQVSKLRPYIMEHWHEIRTSLLKGTYQPQPVRRVEIPKPNGGKRKLGIPTVMDRLIQQALNQVLMPIFDPGFSENSYGFRPGKRGHQAVRKARSYIKEGHRWVIDMDLEKFFDKVNHDKLMYLIGKKIRDGRVLYLIRQFLKSGIMKNGLVSPNEQGTSQGGPLSPLLSNIMLDQLDKELERRNLRFVRYADDCNIYVKSRKAGQRVMEGITKFIESKLLLKVNREKTAFDRPWKRDYLGFSFTANKEPKVRIARKSIKKMKQRIRKITGRSKAMPMKIRIQKLNQYLVGWCGYFALADTPSVFQRLDAWIRRRLRMIMWKQWKKTKTKIRNLIRLGVPHYKAYEWGNSRKAYWRISNSPILHKTLGNSYWSHQGLKSLYEKYCKKRHLFG